MTELVQLNFSEKYQIRLKQAQDKLYIFCLIRKKWLVYTPEEWVRQHVLNYLINDLGYSTSAIALEVAIDITGMRKRADIVVYQQEKPFIMVECKAPHIAISQATFDQIARYNIVLGSQLLMVTNGLNHFYCMMDFVEKRYNFLKELPKKG
ncbi:type I restriction enzyme HsdR N-terminal domain-containing protein [Empedobacter falsenii]|uniref:type I restriction enzyme HsdR N-terminal domain-containing protein n=1 Tax=Empedobacter falsenii TaxID=343874 RepID=UPI0025771D5D|nr:type I restriction enzyme HsdR N-terminal domain-containing protein [Empedobacter falsenii]MDM1297986.1 type I restriction enzyme HsdR N-terminal domain-containing protein [Empedobacter falsenii]MDM1317939.1 type I restriction enzyme HsdR N-terminal domain-containing protein [Empedobacter falsenii]